MKIAITGKRRVTDAQLDETIEFLSLLYRTIPEPELIMQRRYHDALSAMRPGALPPVAAVVDRAPSQARLALSIGGDGTFLRAARWIGSRKIPILGINSGHLGFLADITLEHSDTIVDAIAAMDLSVDTRRMLMVELTSRDGKAQIPPSPYALNEIAVLRDETASMITIEACLDGRPLAAYRADGLIVATPTGSTGYNLSVGGPIIAPSTDCWVISPIAAHSLNMRPLVVPSSSEVELRTSSRVPVFRLSIDGRSVSMPLDTRVKISRAPFVTHIAHRRGHNFVNTLRSKLLWGIGSDDRLS